MDHPPKFRPIIHVGITGHIKGLDGADRIALKDRVRGLLADVKSVAAEMSRGAMYLDAAPVYRLISCLAEGSDRIAAHAALEEGFELQCSLPLPRDRYEACFEDEASRAEFRGLLDVSTSIFENRLESRPQQAFFDAGQVMLGHSDLLIAIWDGEPSAKSGGTADTVRQARLAQHPVLWVRSRAPYEVSILEGCRESEYGKDALSGIVEGFLCPDPEVRNGGPHGSAQGKYYAEKRHTRNFWILYKLLLRGLSPRGEKPRIRFGVPEFAAAAAEELGMPPADDGATGYDKKRAEVLPGHFGWADQLSIRYADVYRSLGLLRHTLVLLATVALAVGFYWGTLWKAPEGWGNVAGFACQFAFLAAIMGLAWMNRRMEWHRRFMDYRILAELVRSARYLHPLGVTFGGIKVPDYHRPMFSWVNWHFRAVLRSLGIPNVILDPSTQSRFLREVEDGLDGQIGFHARTRRRSHHAVKRLHGLWITLISIGIVMIAARVAIQFVHLDQFSLTRDLSAHLNLKSWFNMFALLFPALATCTHALLSQTGFEKLEERSAAMERQLGAFKARLREQMGTVDNGRPLRYTEMRALVTSAHLAMLKEVADWRVFATSMPISTVR